MLLDGLPILVHTVRKFVACPFVTEIVVALRPEDLAWAPICCIRVASRSRCAWSKAANPASNRSRTPCALAPDTDLVAVHDAVRPFIDLPTIEKVIHEAPRPAPPSSGLCPSTR